MTLEPIGHTDNQSTPATAHPMGPKPTGESVPGTDRQSNKRRRRENSDFTNVFGSAHFVEIFNRPAAVYLVQNWDLVRGQDGDCGPVEGQAPNLPPNSKSDDQLRLLRGLITQTNGGNVHNVSYKKSRKQAPSGKGRWYAEGVFSMQTMARRIRHTLCKGLWIDIDFVNCHPVLAQQLCDQSGLSSPWLTAYNRSRETLLEEMMAADRRIKGRDEAKQKILQVLYGCDSVSVDVPWWRNFLEECGQIASHISSLDPENLALCRELGTHNLHARAMSSVLCDKENDCLEALYAFLEGQGCISNGQCVLIFDGLQIRDTKSNRSKTADAHFLASASDFIYKRTNLRMVLKVKPFDEGYQIPDNVDQIVDDVFVIESGDDRSAADEFLRRFGTRLVQSDHQWFWLQDGVYITDYREVKSHIQTLVSRMDIQIRSGQGLRPYSRCMKHVKDCVELIMVDPITAKVGFRDRIWSSNITYLCFQDGVYNLASKRLHPFCEHHSTDTDADVYADDDLADSLGHESKDKSGYQAEPPSTDAPERDPGDGPVPSVCMESRPVSGVMFTLRVDRPFPKTHTEHWVSQLHQLILQPIFPDPHQRAYFLHITARAIAGHVEDKRWYVVTGERNSGKGVICLLWELAFQNYVQTFNCEHLLFGSGGAADPAKRQGWMSPLEFKRIAFSNELRFEPHQKLDGNMIKRFSSGGDTIQLRLNYQDEVQKKLQSTFFMFCNDVPPIEPEDALETMIRFDMKTRFVRQEECTGNLPHLRVGNPRIKEWIRSNQQVVDTFLRVVLNSYEADLVTPPQIVLDDTRNFKGESATSIYDRISEVVKYKDDLDMVVHTDKIKIELEKSGVKGLSSQKVNEYVRKIYSAREKPPEYKKVTVDGKKGMGFNRIYVQSVLSFDYSTERRNEREQNRESNRLAAKRRIEDECYNKFQ